ncbi:MAG: GNAT family N-acetyltransferase [Oscillospiraceae bacterium]|nr:GNAT family N-acetyltransferase [Oscillospiraceae bacterium]
MIETSRLLLRPFTEEDLDIVHALYSDPEIMRYTPFDPMTLEQSQSFLRWIHAEWKKEPPVDLEMAVILKSEQKKIGRAHILIDGEAESAMIGGLLLKPYWGKGYAGEMALAMMDHCFDVLHMHRVTGLCHPDNIASWKMMERCGMRREAYYRRKCRYVKNGKAHWEDELEYAILREERKQNVP